MNLRSGPAWLILALLAIAGSGAIWIRIELATPYLGPAAEVFVDIPRGAGAGGIADALTGAGVLRHKLPFMIYVRWTGSGGYLRAGEYRFAEPARTAQIVRRLVQGDVYSRSLTIPEGLTARETAALMARNGFGMESELSALLVRTDWISDLDPKAASLEGYLFPETYRFSRHATPEEMLKTMIAQFRQRTSATLSEGHLPPGWNLPAIVTLASMIEKEARIEPERALVSSVLANRIRLKMPLDCDATIIYALKQAGVYDGNLRRQDMRLSSPYNTYLHTGLPPGPIANPSLASLQAALEPAQTDYLYYVSRNDGTHVFSKDLRAHLLAVDRFQRHR
jgi:UPF0755 protein